MSSNFNIRLYMFGKALKIKGYWGGVRIFILGDLNYIVTYEKNCLELGFFGASDRH